MVMMVEKEETLVLIMLLLEVEVPEVLAKPLLPPVLLVMLDLEDLSLIIHILFIVL